ncbi:MAG TPA: hypothetical protein VHO25_12150 [Polyangiaceae bacterium]|nr:hypothetical protein [Polyangiaceae bacterium]
MQQALEQAIGELVLGAELALDDPRVLTAWLSRHGVSEADANALRAADVQRLLVYRRLVQHTLRNTVQLAMPRSIARLGPVFDEYFARFLAERGPRTHYLRDVTYELLDWSEPLLRVDPRVAPYLPDLMRHEALRIEMGALPAGRAGHKLEALELDRSVAFIEASRVVRYRFAVHELPDDDEDTSEPASEPTALFVYRSPEHQVRYLRLSPLASAILDKLHGERCSLRDAMTSASAELGFTLNEQVLEGAAQLLADLAERGALLGSAAPAVPSVPSSGE